MLILDSNTVSYYFRGDPQVVPRLQSLRPAEVGVPAIVECELRYGLLRGGGPRSAHPFSLPAKPLCSLASLGGITARQ